MFPCMVYRNLLLRVDPAARPLSTLGLSNATLTRIADEKTTGRTYN